MMVFARKSDYDSIPESKTVDEEMSESPMEQVSSINTALSFRSKLMIAVSTGIAFCVVAMTATRFSTITASIGVSLLGSPDSSSGAPACTFDECFATHCNAEVAPFTCLLHNGGPHGGCSDSPWLPETCDKQCDLSACSDLEIPASTESCDVPCDAKWCEMNRFCGKDAPYQCTSGSSAFGCSSDKLAWTLRSASTTCSACCNSNTC